MPTTDFVFSWEGATGPRGPWRHLDVVRFRGHEALSELFRYDLTLRADAPSPEVDVRQLVGARATLRIATMSTPGLRLVHGVIAEAEELHPVAEGMVYRVTLMPPLVRSLHRVRSRIFLDKTPRQIVDQVLAGDVELLRNEQPTTTEPDEDLAVYTPARDQYVWRAAQSSRLDRAGVRPLCVQYNESDFSFIARLLEEEGIAFHYEHTDAHCLLVLSDADAGRISIGAPIGPGIGGREVTTMKLGSRMRPRSVTLTDYDWKKPALDIVAEAGGEKGRSALFEHHYPGGFADAEALGAPLAQRLWERYQGEASFAAGEGHVRTLYAGALATIQHPKSRYEGEVLITRLELNGEQRGIGSHGDSVALGNENTFECRFECAQKVGGESRFRPSRTTPKPRIIGSQTAFVTAEPNARAAVVNVGDQIGSVRLRFHWDREEERLLKEPSSSWVRVSQMFASAGMGAVFHPRVGDEVVVEFLDGDPDRPIVTGRVYNGVKTSPTEGVGSPTVSGFKSLSMPGGDHYNELTFEDASGAEELRLHAARDFNTVAERNRSEHAKVDALSRVGGNRIEATGADRNTIISANNSEAVGADESITVGASRSVVVGTDQHTRVGGDQRLEIDGRSETVVRRSLVLRGESDVTVQGDTIVVRARVLELDCDQVRLRRSTVVTFDDPPSAPDVDAIDPSPSIAFVLTEESESNA